MRHSPSRKTDLPTLLLALLLSLPGVGLAAPSSFPSMKKGVGDTSGLAASIDGLKVSWYYNWKPAPDAGNPQAEFVPMIWGDYFATDKVLDAIKANPRYTALLAFNEPDGTGESNMTVAQAIALWPKLMATGKRLGSPAVTQSGPGALWLEQFMAQANALGYRVDFLCVHWYDDVTQPQAAPMLASFLSDLHDKYHLPIWLTEFSGGNWDFIAHKPLTYKHNTDFIAKALPLLEGLPFVERYAWFATISDQGNFKYFYEKASLYRSDSDDFTEVGAAYRDFTPEPLFSAASFKRVPYRIRPHRPDKR